MLVRIVRHGRAGHKRDWAGDDAERPLDETGQHQAATLARLLRAEPPGTLLSSPTVRCLQTLEPLAVAWDRPIATDTGLAKDTTASAVLRLLRLAEDGDVLCTHGEVMGAVLERLRFSRAEIDTGRKDVLAKGTLWEITLRHGRVRRLRHVDPRDVRVG